MLCSPRPIDQRNIIAREVFSHVVGVRVGDTLSLLSEYWDDVHTLPVTLDQAQGEFAARDCFIAVGVGKADRDGFSVVSTFSLPAPRALYRATQCRQAALGGYSVTPAPGLSRPDGATPQGVPRVAFPGLTAARLARPADVPALHAMRSVQLAGAPVRRVPCQ